MARAKIIAYLPDDLADAIRKAAARQNKSISDIAEDALSRGLLGESSGVEHAVLIAKLDSIARRLASIERSQETHFELSAHAARFSMSMVPDIAESERPIINARGAERFSNMIAAITRRLGRGKSVWKDNFPAASNTAPAGASNVTRGAPHFDSDFDGAANDAAADPYRRRT